MTAPRGGGVLALQWHHVVSKRAGFHWGVRGAERQIFRTRPFARRKKNLSFQKCWEFPAGLLTLCSMQEAPVPLVQPSHKRPSPSSGKETCYIVVSFLCLTSHVQRCFPGCVTKAASLHIHLIGILHPRTRFLGTYIRRLQQIETHSPLSSRCFQIIRRKVE